MKTVINVMWKVVLFTAPLFLVLHMTISAQQLATVRDIFNNIWDKANHRLMTTPGAGAQGVYETEQTILNDVWDSTNNMLRVSGGSGGGSGGGVVAKAVSYTLLEEDGGKLVTFNGASLTATLPAVPPTSSWYTLIQNLHSSDLTVARNGLTVNEGSSDIVLGQYQMIGVMTDGVNYFARLPLLSGGGGLKITPSSSGITFDASGAVSGCASVGTDTNDAATGSGADRDFSLTCVTPAGFVKQFMVIRQCGLFTATTGSAPSTLQLKFKVNDGSNKILHSGGTFGVTANRTGKTAKYCNETITASAPGAAVNTFSVGGIQAQGDVTSNADSNQTAQPVAVATNAAITWRAVSQWTAAGTGTNTYSILAFWVEAVR